jgi:hypothetical protein
MKKASAETIVRLKLKAGTLICAEDLLPELDMVQAARALHRVWLKGGFERHAGDGMYYYKKKTDDHP